MIARWVASASVSHGRVSPWLIGSVSPRASACCDEHVDGDAVLGVHHDHRAVARGRLHGPQDLPVVAVEDARVGHEELEAGDALGDELVHRLERVVVDAADDLVERVVDRAVAVGLGVPGGEPVLHALAGALHGEVDDRRRAAPGRRAGAGLEGVGGERAAERQLHVRVAVDAARDDVLAGGVDDACRRCRHVGAERGVTGREQRRRSARRRRARPWPGRAGGRDDGAARDAGAVTAATRSP